MSLAWPKIIVKRRLSMTALQPKPEGYVEPTRRPRPNGTGNNGGNGGERRNGGNERRNGGNDRRGGRDNERRGGERRGFGHNNAPKEHHDDLPKNDTEEYF